jgi:uncharacterized protein YabE (DUF348 family)
MQWFSKKLQRLKKVQVQRLQRWRKHPFGLPIFVFVGLVLVSGLALLIVTKQSTATFHPDTSYIAIVSHDGVKQSVPTRERTVGALLKKLNITVAARDRVEPSLSTAIVQDNFRINIYRAIPVTIYDGSATTTAFSAGATPRSIIASTGMNIYPEDRVTAQPAVNLVASHTIGTQIIINRATPITLNVYGTVLSLRTHTKTVGDLLRVKKVKLGPKDSVQPVASTPVTPNMQVFVLRKGTQIVAETQTIAAPQQVVTDESLSFGTTVVRQQGSNGTQVLTYQVNTQNGVEVSRTLLQTVVTVQPVTQIVARGKAVSIPADKQAVMAQAGIASSDYAYVDYIISHESGWCPTKVQGHPGVCPGYAPDPFPTSGGYGLGQATPGTKMASAGADWKTNPVTQLRWATSYALGRYKSWEAAYNYWTVHHNW